MDVPKRSAGNLDMGLWSLGLARSPRSWNRVATSVLIWWSSYPSDSPKRFGEGFLAKDPPAHPRASRNRVRTEHGGRFAGGAMLKSLFNTIMERRSRQLI